MGNLEALKDSKYGLEESTKSSLNSLKKGLDKLKEFQEKTNKETLLHAANFLIESLKFEKNQAEPYFFLAYIFYIMDNNRLALKYLKICELINPGFPELKRFKALILGILV
jgi:hypothetical protein